MAAPAARASTTATTSGSTTGWCTAIAEAVRLHLCAELAYQQGLVRFIENHDEPRAAATFPGGRQRAAAVVALTQPGARLVHDGQLDGRRVHVPVFLGRAPDGARRTRTSSAGTGPLLRVVRDPALHDRAVAAVRAHGLAGQRALEPARRLVLGGGASPADRRSLADRRQPGRRDRRRARARAARGGHCGASASASSTPSTTPPSSAPGMSSSTASTSSSGHGHRTCSRSGPAAPATAPQEEP